VWLTAYTRTLHLSTPHTPAANNQMLAIVLGCIGSVQKGLFLNGGR